MDLHGMRARAARELVGRASADVVAICHGKGTGVLREVTHEVMRARYLFVSTKTRGAGAPGVSTFVAKSFVGESERSVLRYALVVLLLCAAALAAWRLGLF